LVVSWVIDDDNATLAEDQGEIVLRFRSGKVHMVASSQSPVTISVVVYDKPQTPPDDSGEAPLYAVRRRRLRHASPAHPNSQSWPQGIHVFVWLKRAVVRHAQQTVDHCECIFGAALHPPSEG
jgi:hypothetical protein